MNSQFLTISLPLYKNLNRKSVGSAQVSQDSQVIGQAADTPGSSQRFLVSLVATQLQYLETYGFGLPTVGIFSLRVVSTQLMVGVADGAGVVGAGVAFVGVPVGAIGAAEGLGDGLMEEVGLLVGSSLGALLGSKLGGAKGAVVGASLGALLGSKLGA
jgi:hypothetical protein